MRSSTSVKLHVLYASATGTAEDVSQQAAEALSDAGAEVVSYSTLDGYDLKYLPHHAASEHIFVFIIATCGDGHAPRNMSLFWNFLCRADLPSDVLSHLRFTIFGLGDRAYIKFNAAARRLHARLLQLGGQSLLPLVLGDDSADGGYDVPFVSWLDQCVKAFPFESSRFHLHRYSSGLRPPRVKVDFLPRSSKVIQSSSPDSWCKGQSSLFVVDSFVTSNQVISDPKFLTDNREVRHVELDVSHCDKNSGFPNYDPGDVVHVLPRNRPSAVDAFLKLMDLTGEDIVDVQDAHACVTVFGRAKLNIQTPCTIRQLVSAQFDLWCTPRRRFFQQLALFATDSMQRKKLEELGSFAASDMLTQYVYREKRTLLMVLRDFPSARPSLARLIELIPRIRSRAFSIASSRKAHPGSIHICAAMVQYETPLRFARIGLCSSFFMRLNVGDVVPVALERGIALRFHRNLPAILIGPGTGVAPMRSFVSSCDADGIQRILFYGCRNEKGDFLYKEEWKQWTSQGVLNNVVTAFSRAGPEKVYVQYRIREMALFVWHILGERKGYVYVAGAAGELPKAVREALVDVCRKAGGLDDRAERFVRRLEIEGKLQIECW